MPGCSCSIWSTAFVSVVVGGFLLMWYLLLFMRVESMRLNSRFFGSLAATSGSNGDTLRFCEVVDVSDMDIMDFFECNRWWLFFWRWGVGWSVVFFGVAFVVFFVGCVG